MRKLTVEMSEVGRCAVAACAYNGGGLCHAKAITVGDGTIPHCDTLFITSTHVRDGQGAAGVGACKISGCRFNRDFECLAGNIEVGYANNSAQCLTYQLVQSGQGSSTIKA